MYKQGPPGQRGRASVTGKTHPEGPASSVSPPSYALYVVYPPELAGRAIDLAPGSSIGREPAQAAEGQSSTPPIAVLPHMTVSRRHCTIQGARSMPILAELGSSNGTKLNGVPLTTPQVMPRQSVVRLGSVLGVVDEHPPPGAPPTPAVPGIAPAVVRAREALGRAAGSPASVLILGETGTGKERVAAELHRQSGRTGPYVKFSCAELARELVESQLFGHERGAFTGAAGSQPGLFAAADGGTLFLDEVGELPLELQEGEVRPLGSVSTRRVDVRVVAATNRDLRLEVARGAFRRDLFARLSFFEVDLPALRERRQDILWWLELLCTDFAAATGVRRPELRIQPDAAEALLLHTWPENLRGLDRFVYRVLSSGETSVGRRLLGALMPEIASEPPPPVGAPGPATPPLAAEARRTDSTQPPALDRPSREQFLGVFEATGRNVRATSKHFGKDRRQIYRWLELFGIER
jgi:DNA-binding NtrC family response regulator